MSQVTVSIDLMDTGYDTEVDVEFGVDGEYVAQTMTDPAEYPEIELYKVTHGDNCVIDLLTDEDIKAIEAQCWKCLEDEAEEAADAFYERDY